MELKRVYTDLSSVRSPSPRRSKNLSQLTNANDKNIVGRIKELNSQQSNTSSVLDDNNIKV